MASTDVPARPTINVVGDGDPTWLKILRAVALVLGVLCMAVFLYAAFTIAQQLQQIQEAFSGPSIEEQTGEPFDIEEPVLPEGETSGWTENNEDGSVSYCYLDPEFSETICEPIR